MDTSVQPAGEELRRMELVLEALKRRKDELKSLPGFSGIDQWAQSTWPQWNVVKGLGSASLNPHCYKICDLGTVFNQMTEATVDVTWTSLWLSREGTWLNVGTIEELSVDSRRKWTARLTQVNIDEVDEADLALARELMRVMTAENLATVLVAMFANGVALRQEQAKTWQTVVGELTELAVGFVTSTADSNR